jgi:hypothetical protein
MRITKNQLRRIIKEELGRVLGELSQAGQNPTMSASQLAALTDEEYEEEVGDTRVYWDAYAGTTAVDDRAAYLQSLSPTEKMGELQRSASSQGARHAEEMAGPTGDKPEGVIPTFDEMEGVQIAPVPPKSDIKERRRRKARRTRRK